MNLDTAVVVNEPEFAKAVHEEADAGARSADHLCQGLLRDGRYATTGAFQRPFSLASRISACSHAENLARGLANDCVQMRPCS